MKTHLKDIRLYNNAGISMPLCRATARLLDLDATAWKKTGKWEEVTCLNCLKMAPQRYPWAYGEKHGATST